MNIIIMKQQLGNHNLIKPTDYITLFSPNNHITFNTCYFQDLWVMFTHVNKHQSLVRKRIGKVLKTLESTKG